MIYILIIIIGLLIFIYFCLIVSSRCQQKEDYEKYLAIIKEKEIEKITKDIEDMKGIKRK